MGFIHNIKLGDFFIKHHRKLIFLCFTVGICWFLALASEQLNNKTYFSENALLPGLVVREFNPGSSLFRLLDNLEEESRRHVRPPYAWIRGQFTQLGLDVYNHNFSIRHPFGSSVIHRGNNIYAILRAPKASSTEALVISTPYRGGKHEIRDPTLPSIALMVEIARYFRKNAYWSKDVIFLITEHELLGFQAWLNAYHDTHSRFIDHGTLHGRSGLLQGVVNLEITHRQFSSLDIRIEGLNGQLPNLDLFNLAVELSRREMMMPTFQSRLLGSPNPFECWQHNLVTMMLMMSLQATGLPTGSHGLFHQYGVQALTLASNADNIRDLSKTSIIHVGRIVEGVFRSLNNLLEKFHQSFFFYLLASTQRYISIGLYMPPFALMAVPVLVKALYLYFKCKTTIKTKQDFNVSQSLGVWLQMDTLSLSYIFGFVAFSLPGIVEFLLVFNELSTIDTFYFLVVSFTIAAMVFSCLYHRMRYIDEREYDVKLCLYLLQLGGFLYTLSLINISLAVLLTLIYGPVSILMNYRNRFKFFYVLLTLLINPLVAAYFVTVYQSYLADSELETGEHFVKALPAHKMLIYYSVEDMFFYNNWNYKIGTIFMLPLWLQLWMVSTAKCYNF